MSDSDFAVTEYTETPESSFVMDLAKTASLSVAATAGTLVGFVVVGYVADGIQKFRTARAAKKASAIETPSEA